MEKLKICPPDKILNPKTNKCVLKTGAIGKKLLSTDNKEEVIKKEIKNKDNNKKVNKKEEIKICPPNKILNPKTNKCVSKTGAIGKKLLSTDNKEEVIKKEIKNKDNNKKVNKKEEIKICPPDKILNPKTNKCVSKTGAIGKKLVMIDKKEELKNDKKFLLDTVFRHYPLDHSFDKEAVKKFIDASDVSVKDIVKKIIDNTDHISFEKFLMRLNSNIKELLAIVEKDKKTIIYCYLGDYLVNVKNKSNYWMYVYVFNYIEKKTKGNVSVKLIENIDLIKENNAKIILIDDCVYSGSQMHNTIIDIMFISNFSFDFYLLIPYMSKDGMKSIKEAFEYNRMLHKCSYNFLKNIYIIKCVNDILTTAEMYKMNFFYSGLVTFNYKFMIYFDHKLADTVSIITPFYLGIVPCKENYNINIHKNKLLTIPPYLLHKYKIIPIIKNCSYYTNNINFMNADCPAPPYKKQKFNRLLYIQRFVLNKKAKSVDNIRNNNRNNNKKMLSY